MRRRTILLAIALSTFPLIARANATRIENALPGTNDWRLTLPASSDEIEGYASTTSAAHGESVDLFLSGDGSTVAIEIYRMGWYSGEGGRRVHSAERPLMRQPTPAPHPVTGLIECDWQDAYRVTIDPSWVSGVYLAKLTARPSGRQNYVMFVVRDEARTGDLLFQSSVTTMAAYNNWGGKSLYRFNSTGAAADLVSFNRPYSTRTGPFEFLFGWEYQMVRFLEREGYDVSYGSNVDTHARPQLLLRYEAFLSVGHDEYWSWEMRRGVEAARNAGADLGFFSANTCYWQIRFEPGRDGRPNRNIVSYKEDALSKDPLAQDGNPSNDHLLTVKWRDVPVNQPEEALLGVMFTAEDIDTDIVIDNASHWVFNNTGLRNGDKLPGLLGYEVDRMFSAFPANTIRLARSPFTRADGTSDFSDMTIYTHTNGALVFATGTIQWSWGLDDFNAAGTGGSRVHPAAQQITRNVLNRFIYGERHKRRAAHR